MIELYGCSSPNVLKVIVALEELETPYRFRYVDVVMGEHFTPEFGKLNPNRRVPIIVDPEGPDGRLLTLWESGAILIYLAEKAGALMPHDATERCLALQWLMFQMGGIGPMFGQYVHFTRYAGDQTYSRARYHTEVLRLYDVVETRLAEAPYLGGSEYSIADIAAWSWLHSLEIDGVDRADYAHMKRWLDEIAARPAVVRAREVRAGIKVHNMVALAQDAPEKLDRFFGRGQYSRAPA